MLYAIKSDTLFFARHTNRVDLEAFTFLYPLADAALIRKMEGAEITLERLEYVTRAGKTGILRDQVFTAFIGETPREDFIPYTADFFLQLEDVKWTIIAGIVGTTLIVSVRNLGYSRNAGEFVKRWFADIGCAGGHRAMAKAVVPIDRFRAKYGDLDGAALTGAARRNGRAVPPRSLRREEAHRRTLTRASSRRLPVTGLHHGRWPQRPRPGVEQGPFCQRPAVRTRCTWRLSPSWDSAVLLGCFDDGVVRDGQGRTHREGRRPSRNAFAARSIVICSIFLVMLLGYCPALLWLSHGRSTPPDSSQICARR